MKRQGNGFTLIEVMVAVLLGSLIVTTFLKILLSNIQQAKFNEYQLAIQQNVRLAYFYLNRDIRMAGARLPSNGQLVSPIYDKACGAILSCTAEGGGTANDTLAIQFEPSNGVDCVGNTVPAGELTVNHYYIATDNSVQQGEAVVGLFCRGYDPTAGAWRGTGTWRQDGEILVAGVERLQVRYGYADNATDEVTSYRTANNVTDWNKVRSVEISVLVSGGDTPSVAAQRSRTYNLLGSGAVSFNDRTPRAVFTTVNSIYTTKNGLDSLGDAVLWVE